MNKKLKNAILLSTLFTFIYAMMPQMNLSYSVVFMAFLFANVLLFRMVYVILKHGQESKKTFSEAFYDDIDPEK